MVLACAVVIIMQLHTLRAGSPADKADLEVADEILEINGESLANSTHTDVIAHIHNVSWNTFYAIRIRRVLTRRFPMYFDTVHQVEDHLFTRQTKDGK